MVEADSGIQVPKMEILKDSGITEYYTPSYIIEAARKVLGEIDLDPASCEYANKTVQAKTIFTIEDDGLSKEWFGRVWMNHPFSKQYNEQWVKKLIDEYNEWRVKEALCITYASTSERWFQPLLDFKQCFVSPRVNYINRHGAKSGATKGSVVTYIGDSPDKFVAAFHHLGKIK